MTFVRKFLSCYSFNKYNSIFFFYQSYVFFINILPYDSEIFKNNDYVSLCFLNTYLFYEIFANLQNNFRIKNVSIWCEIRWQFSMSSYMMTQGMAQQRGRHTGTTAAPPELLCLLRLSRDISYWPLSFIIDWNTSHKLFHGLIFLELPTKNGKLRELL